MTCSRSIWGFLEPNTRELGWWGAQRETGWSLIIAGTISSLMASWPGRVMSWSGWRTRWNVFSCRIQGSGRIRLINGEYVRLGYAAKNGRPWGPIGRLLIEKGLIPKEAMSMQAIRRYLKQHPEEMAEIFSYDPSYVFFSKVEGRSFRKYCSSAHPRSINRHRFHTFP